MQIDLPRPEDAFCFICGLRPADNLFDVGVNPVTRQVVLRCKACSELWKEREAHAKQGK